MKKLNLIVSLILLFFIYAHDAHSQQTICVGEDITLCTGSPLTIEECGSLDAEIGIAIDDPNEVYLSDDSWSAVVNIGFTFNFYGVDNTQCVIGSNGIISFNLANANNYCPWALTGYPVGNTIPDPGFDATHNTAMVCYQDMNPQSSLPIKYGTVGTAPNRQFVVIYENIPMFGDGECNYIAIILNETSNSLEYHIANKPTPETWNDGLAIQGVHNQVGSDGVTTPGRNNEQWTAVQDAKLYTPTSPTNTLDYTVSDIQYMSIAAYSSNTLMWENSLGETFPYNNGVLEIDAVDEGTVEYYLTLSSSSCDAQVGAVSESSFVTGVSASMDVSSTDDICSSGQGTATATGTATGGPYTYTWPALGETGSTVDGLYAGNYLVNMTDGLGCTTSATVNVGDTPADYGQSSTPVSCPGGSDGTATAEMIPEIGNVTYQWDDPSNQTTQTATGLVAGTYNCTITSDVGCSNTITVEVTEIPEMQLTVDDITNVSCNSDNDGEITVSITGGTSPYSYSWDHSSSTTNVGADLSANDHTVTVTDDNGCIVFTTETITEPAPLNITFITEDSTICAESEITLTATGTGGSSDYIFTWTENGDEIGTGSSIQVDPSDTNTEYCVELSEVCGSPTDEECMTITFPTPIVPMLTPNQFQDCVSGEFTFTNTSENAAEIESMQVDLGDGKDTLVMNQDNSSHTYNSVGVYTLNLDVTSIHGCQYTNTLEDYLEVVPTPTAQFTFSNNPTTIFETVVTVNDLSSSDVVDWSWSSPGSEPSNSNLTTPTFDFPDGETGKYDVTLAVTSYHGCVDTMTLTLTVQDDVLFYAPNTFTPDGDEFNQTWDVSFMGADLHSYHILIFNRWGETIWESNDPNVGWDGTYNGKPVSQGMYVWKATAKNVNDDGKLEYNGYINLLR